MSPIVPGTMVVVRQVCWVYELNYTLGFVAGARRWCIHAGDLALVLCVVQGQYPDEVLVLDRDMRVGWATLSLLEPV